AYPTMPRKAIFQSSYAADTGWPSASRWKTRGWQRRWCGAKSGGWSPPAPLFDVQQPKNQPLGRGPNSWALTPVEDWTFSPDHAIPLLENHFGVLSLEGFGLAGKPAAAAAAGAILQYVRSTQPGGLDHVDRIGFYERRSALVLDAVTVRNLELLEPLFAGGEEFTLSRAVDVTSTPMGRRL